MIGLDIGSATCKMAVRERGGAVRLVVSRLPEGSIREGEPAFPDQLARHLRALRRSERVRERSCTLVLPPDQVLFRRASVPPMSAAELALNLPYELREFVRTGPADYVYDYAVERRVTGDDGALARLELLVSATRRDLSERYAALVLAAGMRLKAIVPAQTAYARLVSAWRGRLAEDARDDDFALVDVGHGHVVVALFQGTRFDSLRSIDLGCADVDRAIAEASDVDLYTASGYKHDNHDGILDGAACHAVYDRIAREVGKVVSFYELSNPGHTLARLCVTGGGALIAPLVTTLAEEVGVDPLAVTELVGEVGRGAGQVCPCTLAVATMLEGELM